MEAQGGGNISVKFLPILIWTGAVLYCCYLGETEEKQHPSSSYLKSFCPWNKNDFNSENSLCLLGIMLGMGARFCFSIYLYMPRISYAWSMWAAILVFILCPTLYKK